MADHDYRQGERGYEAGESSQRGGYDEESMRRQARRDPYARGERPYYEGERQQGRFEYGEGRPGANFSNPGQGAGSRGQGSNANRPGWDDQDRGYGRESQYSRWEDQGSRSYGERIGGSSGEGESYGMGYGYGGGSARPAGGGQRFGGQQGYGGQPDLARGGNRPQQGSGDSGWQRSMSAGPYSGRGPKGYQRSDDRIHEEVCETLTMHPGIDACEVEVRVQGGEVTLSGSVNEREQKRLAEDAIEGVSGVKDVNNQLRVSGHGHKGQGATSHGGGKPFPGTAQDREMQNASSGMQTHGEGGGGA